MEQPLSRGGDLLFFCARLYQVFERNRLTHISARYFSAAIGCGQNSCSSTKVNAIHHMQQADVLSHNGDIGHVT